MNVSIRRAVVADATSLAQLRCEFWLGQQAIGLVDGRDLAAEVILAETERLLTRPRTVLIVAEEPGMLLGYAFATVQAAPHLDPPLVSTIEEIFVSVAQVRKGVAALLAERAFLELPGHRASRQQIRVLANNNRGRAFWEKLGFKDAVHIMERASED